jgi:hypothetical protein
MSNQQQTQTPPRDRNPKADKNGNVAEKPVGHHVHEFDAPQDLDGKNDSGPDPEIDGREIPPQ